ncbi:MAG: EamA family transporter [Nitrospirae bacterium]|nr:EamA family transporter [Nitrospirota bacterium]
MVIWSSQGIIIKSSRIGAVDLIFYSVLFSVVYQSFMFLSPRMRSGFPPLHEIPKVFLLSLVILTNTMAFFIAYENTTIANAVFTHYIAPVIVAVLAPLILKERVTCYTLLAVALSTVGLWVMLSEVSVVETVRSMLTSGHKTDTNIMGIIAGLVSGVAYAAIILTVRKFAQSFNPYVIVFLQNCFVVLLLMPFAGKVPVDKLWLLAGMGALYSTVAPFLYYRGLQCVEANRAAVMGYAEPLSAIALGMAFLQETPEMKSIVGGVLIIVAGYIVITQKCSDGNTKVK